MEHEEVYIDWPSGKGGPYIKTSRYDKDLITVIVDGEAVSVPSGWVIYEEQEFDLDRLYWLWDNEDSRPVHAEIGAVIDTVWNNVRPVCRYWEELTDAEKKSFVNAIRTCTYRNVPIDYFDAGNIFASAYFHITGEDHP